MHDLIFNSTLESTMTHIPDKKPIYPVVSPKWEAQADSRPRGSLIMFLKKKKNIIQKYSEVNTYYYDWRFCILK